MTNKDFKLWAQDLPVYITTSVHQMACLPAFCYLFNKFWVDEVKINILGYDKPNFDLPKNINYISLGKDRGPEYWSDDMIDFFSNVKEEFFYTICEDGFILKKVNENLLYDSYQISKKLSKENPNFLRFNLTHCVSTRGHTFLQKTESGGELILSNKGVDYRHSLQHSIWNTKNFLKILSRGMTPWQVELDESARYSNFDVYAFRNNCPLNTGNAYSKGKKVQNWHQDVWRHINGFEGLNKEDIEYIEKNNWVPEINLKIKRDSGGVVIS